MLLCLTKSKKNQFCHITLTRRQFGKHDYRYYSFTSARSNFWEKRSREKGNQKFCCDNYSCKNLISLH